MPWKNPPSEAFKQYRETFGKTQRASAIRILRCVVSKSPVDTGVFRGNWNVSESFPEFSYNLSKTDKGGSTTIKAGAAKIKAAGEFKRLFITNNVPYASVLNYGRPPGTRWTRLAPLYFMESCVSIEVVKLNRKKIGARQVLT